MRVFHRGLIIVGLPFLIGLFLSLSLFVLLNQAEQERLAESKLLRNNATTAEFMALVSQAPYVLIAAVNLKSEDLFKQADQKFGEVEKLWPELLTLAEQGKARQLDLDSARKSMDELLNGWKSISKERAVPAGKYTATVFSGLMSSRSTLMNLMYKSLPGEKELLESQDKVERLKQLQLINLGLAVLLNIGLGVFLFHFYKRGIIDRIGVMLKNTRSLAKKEWLAPEMGGGDEIGQFDHAFHSTRKMLLRAAEAEQKLFDNTSDVICVLDEDYVFLRVNPASLKNWEYESDEMRGRNLQDLIDADSFEKIKYMLDGNRQSEQSASFEALIKLKSGTMKESLWSIFWSAIDSRLYCIVHDISERKRVERIRKQFMIMVNSDLQAPLAEIDSEVDQLASGAIPVPEPAADKFIGLRKNIARLLGLVDEIVQVATVEKGRLAIDTVEVDIGELLKRAVDEVEVVASARELKLELLPCEGKVLVDADKILQVLVNFLSNAIKFSHPDKSISISAELKGASYFFHVKDQGRGIPRNKLSTIFEKFSQVQLADGKRRSGIGLGLPICKQIIEAHRGKIGVESDGANGATFWFSIPSEPRLAEANSPKKSMKDAARSKRSSTNANLDGSQAAEPSSRGPSLSLAGVGMMLVLVPILFELTFVSTLALSFNRLENERSQEIIQRRIAFTASRLLRLMSLFTADTDSSGEAGKHENIAAEWDGNKARLAGLLAGNPESSQLLSAIKQNSKDMLELAAHLQDSYRRSVEMLGPRRVRVGESVYSQNVRKLAIQDAISNLPRNRYFLMKRRERLEPQLALARQEESKIQNELDKNRLQLFADKSRLEPIKMDLERRRQHRESIEKELNEVIESEKTLEAISKADTEKLRRDNLDAAEREQVRQEALPENAGDLLTLVQAAGQLEKIVEKAESGGFPNAQKTAQHRQILSQLIVGGLIADLLVSLALALQFNSFISRRLNVLNDNAKRVAEGENLNPLIGGNDEIAELDRAFHEASAQVLDSRKKERAIFDNCKDVVCIVSASGNFISVNKAAESIFGHSTKELMEMRVLDLFDSSEHTLVHENLLLVQEQDCEGLMDCRMKRKDESTVFAHWSFSRKKGPTPIICTIRDESDLKELENLRQEFLALVSHELRTPLFAIESVCQLSQQGIFGEFSDEALTVTAIIRKNIRSLLNVVNDILDLEKLEAEMMMFDKQSVLLKDFADALKQSLASFVPATQLSFEFDGDFQDVPFLADKERLCQSLSNFCKFLHFRSEKKDYLLKIKAERREHGVRFRISDQGPAVDAQTRQEIFRRFKEKVDIHSRVRGAFNADLALPLSARIIEAHGGKVILKKGEDGSNVFVAAIL